ncbi:efflux RND transporter periplasmic adaptor subunit [Celerinatantimonas yamalensis]|uniref:Efflux RND transporter periplasmic adaptor subunit n=1 Tax=Celerinatantimonas yamalensis TaxID=559956 RepID=A0ABW9G7K5_9GAMM
MKPIIRLWIWISVSALLALTSNVMAQDAPLKNKPPSQRVGVVTMKLQSVPITAELPGRAVAYEKADIRPRVNGIIMEKLYQAGAELKKGDPLFRLDDSSYQATVASDEATLVEAQANLPVKQSAYNRAKKLEGSGYTTADVDSAKYNLASAKATLLSAEAALKYAKIQLGWTTIVSPIEGVADVSSVSIGDLVSSGQSDSLTTVTTLDPIFIDMVAPIEDMLNFRNQIKQGSIQPGKKVSAQLQLDDGDTFEGSGALVTYSPTVSTSTGSVTVRFKFDNPDHIILPGMFVRGTLMLGSQQAFLIPQRAGSHEADGSLSIFVIGSDGKSKKVSLKTYGSYQNNWIVRSGVSANEQVIVDGQKNLSEGVPVTPVEVTINSNGTTQDTAPSQPNGMTKISNDPQTSLSE